MTRPADNTSEAYDNLAVAIIAQAVRDAQGLRKVSPEDQVEARAWLVSADCLELAFHLGYDVGEVFNGAAQLSRGQETPAFFECALEGLAWLGENGHQGQAKEWRVDLERRALPVIFQQMIREHCAAMASLEPALAG